MIGVSEAHTRFDKALEFVLKVENGLRVSPDEPGGKANYGITQNTYNTYRKSRHQPTQSVRWIKRSEVRNIYRDFYWLQVSAEQFPSPLDLVVFDTAVHCGPSKAISILAKARHRSGKYGDGSLENTIKYYFQLREAFYRQIAKSNPENKKYLKGWLNRLKLLKKEIGYDSGQ